MNSLQISKVYFASPTITKPTSLKLADILNKNRPNALNKITLVLLFLFIFSSNINSQPDSTNFNLSYRILLIGDAGNPIKEGQEPVLSALQKQLSIYPSKTTVVFLGDNIYPDGMPPKQSPERKEAERRLNEQIKTIVNSNSNGIFIPGNHDWNNGDDDGWDRIKSVDKYIIDKKLNNVIMLPHNGCPGPEVVDLGEKIRLIIIDTDWWLNGNVQANKDNSKCNPGDEQSILDSLRSALKNKGKRFAIIAAHHPLESYGVHGGYFNWKQHIFPLRDLNNALWIPLPVIGSLYPILRKSGISSQDLSSDEYRHMINKIEAILSKYSNWIYAGGHEHSLQVLKGINNNLYLVSGFGTFEHDEYLTEGEKTIFAVLEPGFMQLDFNNDGSVILSVISGKTGVPKEIFIMNVK
ncbi:MAG: metallophosphoesterase [Bacteroidetes bacterium]|nr:metallophosphoesterase [Bacteroidota bacterium]